jgi:molybdenum cofactor cytidylyltransferase
MRGHPVGFSSRLKDELLAVSGDEGARAVVRRNDRDVRVIECDDPGILRDIDTREDLQT